MVEPNTKNILNYSDDTTVSLLQRRDGLDKLLSNCAAAGIELPQTEVDELAAIRAELTRRNEEHTELPGVKSWTDWLGTTIKTDPPTMLDGLIGNGRYSFVFKATSLDTLGEGESDEKKMCVVKVARDPEDLQAGPFSTEALKIIPFQTGPISPGPDQMMQLQMKRLRTISGDNVIAVENFGSLQERAFYCMPLIDGVTLRQYLSDEDLTIQKKLAIFHAIARALAGSTLNHGKVDAAKSQNLEDALYHGDLTPDNIFVEWLPAEIRIVDKAEQVNFSPEDMPVGRPVENIARITFIDPGYFGPLDCAEGRFDTCMISTPSYYPLLEPDDLMAVGICMWEAIVGRHPLQAEANAGQNNESLLDSDVADLINFRNSLLQPYLTPLFSLQLPRSQNQYISEKIESLLIKALRLRLNDDGKLALAQGFADFNELELALAELL